MEPIKNIISHILKDEQIDSKIKSLGDIRQVVGSTTYLVPFNEEYKALAITVVDNKIVNVGITLKDKFSLKNIEKILEVNPVIRKNNYDEKIVISYTKDQYQLIFNQHENFEFNQFDIRFF